MKLNCMTMIKFIPCLIIVSLACGKGSGGSGSDVTPGMNFDDISIMEGNGGTGTAEITLKLSQATSKEVKVTYSTVEGTAKAGSDFTAATAQTVTFKANETEKKIVISVVADDIREGDETFQVRVESPVNVNLL